MIAILRKKKFSTEKRGKEEEEEGEEERVLKYNKSRQIFHGMEKKRKIKNDVYRLELMCDENPPSRTHFDRLLVSKKYKQFNPAQMDPPAMEFRIQQNTEANLSSVQLVFWK